MPRRSHRAARARSRSARRARRRSRSASYFGFTKHVPFTHGFRVKAVFQSANSIRTNSPVRIAGVERRQGHEDRAPAGTDAAVVTMEIDDKGLPIHKDATAKIRPRIFLEGNFFVDLQPGHAGDADARRRRHAADQRRPPARCSSTRS